MDDGDPDAVDRTRPPSHGVAVAIPRRGGSAAHPVVAVPVSLRSLSCVPQAASGAVLRSRMASSRMAAARYEPAMIVKAVG